MLRSLSDTSEKSASLNSHASPMQFPCKSLPNPILLPFLGRDLKRFTSVPGPLWVRCDTVVIPFQVRSLKRRLCQLIIENGKFLLWQASLWAERKMENGNLKIENFTSEKNNHKNISAALYYPSNSYAPPLLLLCNSHLPPILRNGFTTVLERRQSEGWAKAEHTKCDFFLELNAKHIHTPQNEGITIRISGSLRACICLPNIYTTPTHHIHSSMHTYEILCSFTLVWEIYHVWRPVYMLCICLANIYTLLTYWTSV